LPNKLPNQTFASSDNQAIWSPAPGASPWEQSQISNLKSTVFAIAPDWTIEIISPDQSQTKVTKNILHCLKHGTQMGWLIAPEEPSVFVDRPTESTALKSW
jgi:Uncharacterized protein conserved in cyanobacteria